MKSTRLPRYAEAARKTAPRVSALSLLTNIVLLSSGLFTCMTFFN